MILSSLFLCAGVLAIKTSFPVFWRSEHAPFYRKDVPLIKLFSSPAQQAALSNVFADIHRESISKSQRHLDAGFV